MCCSFSYCCVIVCETLNSSSCLHSLFHSRDGCLLCAKRSICRTFRLSMHFVWALLPPTNSKATAEINNENATELVDSQIYLYRRNNNNNNKKMPNKNTLAVKSVSWKLRTRELIRITIFSQRFCCEKTKRNRNKIETESNSHTLCKHSNANWNEWRPTISFTVGPFNFEFQTPCDSCDEPNVFDSRSFSSWFTSFTRHSSKKREIFFIGTVRIRIRKRKPLSWPCTK